MGSQLLLSEVAHQLEFKDIMMFVRKDRGLSARELSTRCGLSPSYVSKIERGESVPTLDNFAKLVSALGCSVEEVYVLVRSLDA